VSHPGIVFEIRPERREEVMRGRIERAKRAVVFSAKTVRLRRRDYFRLTRFEPRNAGDRKLAGSHQYLTDRFRNDVLARDRRNTRAQLFHVAFFDAPRRRQRFESKDGGLLMPLPALPGEATKVRGLARAAWTRPVQSGFLLSFRFTHSCAL
jgi:hypothetical protein